MGCEQAGVFYGVKEVLRERPLSIQSRHSPQPVTGKLNADSVGAGLPANTGTAGAIHRGAGFAGKPAPTKDAVESNGSYGSIASARE